MEIAIPISEFDTFKVKWSQPKTGPFRKTIPFTYEHNSIQFNSLIIGLHPLKVVEVDMERNQLTLEESKKSTLLTKISHFQHSVNIEIEKRSKAWSEDFKTCSIQPWLKSNRLTLYLSDKPETLSFYTEDGPDVFSDKTVKPGDMIRAIVKIQGVSLQMSEDNIWTGKSRIQHHILQLYKLSGTTD
jgi:hypothetical protein